MVIRGHQWSSVVISGHQRSSGVISGHQWSSGELTWSFFFSAGEIGPPPAPTTAPARLLLLLLLPLLAAGPREARSYFGGSMQRHVESPLLHSQNQTLSTARRVEQA